eukprot:2669507-Amphidinium_carterae.1
MQLEPQKDPQNEAKRVAAVSTCAPGASVKLARSEHRLTVGRIRALKLILHPASARPARAARNLDEREGRARGLKAVSKSLGSVLLAVRVQRLTPILPASHTLEEREEGARKAVKHVNQCCLGRLHQVGAQISPAVAAWVLHIPAPESLRAKA